MITDTMALAGMLLIGRGVGLSASAPFPPGLKPPAWIAIFFFASAAASSAYLTASEIFPLETRAMAIAVFYALGTLIGGVTGPFVFGFLIGSGSQWAVAGGYAGAAVLMIGAAVCEALLGVEAAGNRWRTWRGHCPAAPERLRRAGAS